MKFMVLMLTMSILTNHDYDDDDTDDDNDHKNDSYTKKNLRYCSWGPGGGTMGSPWEGSP